MNALLLARALKKSELQMKVAEEGLSHIRSIYDKVKGQVDSAPRDDGTLLEKRKELQREVDVTKRTLAQQVTSLAWGARGGGGGVLPCISYIGMFHPIGYHFHGPLS